MSEGWAKLHRSLCDNKLWLSETFTKAQAWVDLFLNANHADGSFFVRGIEVKVKRGQIGWSELKMAHRWKWSRGKVRRFLKTLKTEQQIVQQTTRETSIITITNYDVYQSCEMETVQQTVQQVVQQKDTKRYTNNKNKKEKNEKKEEIYRKFNHLFLSKKDFGKLVEHGWSKEEIDEVLDGIENYKKNTNYKSLFLTSKNWLKKRRDPLVKENNSVKKLTPEEFIEERIKQGATFAR